VSATIRRRAAVDGTGLNKGAATSAHLLPREERGMVLRRTDLPGTPEVAANIEFLASAPHTTTLAHGDATVGTVEHLLATCFIFGIDRLLIEVDGPELPFGDGSARIWFEAVDRAGVKELPDDEPAAAIARPVRVGDGPRGIMLASADTWSVQFSGTFPDGTRQTARWTSETDARAALATARTFARLRDVIRLRRAGLLMGGSPANGIVCIDAEPTPEERSAVAEFWPDIRLEPTSDGLLAPQAKRLHNEFAQHKLLDLLGDLMLARPLPPCEVVAEQAGHDLTHRLVREVDRLRSRA